MRRVLKWALTLDDEPEAIGAGRVLMVGHQHGVVTVWTVEPIVETNDQNLSRTVRIFGTGHVVPDEWEPIGSVQVDGFVWHVFEEVRF